MSDTHDTTTPFDRRITLLNGRAPSALIDAMVYVHDTVETAQMAARALFGDKATPEIALALYDRIAAEHQRRDHATRAPDADE
jgi:hypothetical protein